MKYIDAKKLIAEIERLKKDNGKDGRPSNVAEMLYSQILSIITSLQQEQSSLPHNLDEAAEEFGERQGIELAPFAKKFFKCGAGWMAGQGETLDSLIWKDENDKLFIEAFVDENKFKMADNVTIQIRKK